MSTGHDSAADIAAQNPFVGNRLGYDDLPDAVASSIELRATAVTFASGVTHRFHHQWLRHCCYCPSCGNPADGIRFNTLINFAAEIAPSTATIVDGDLRIEWTDGHESTYGPDWLLLHAYDGGARDRRAAWVPTLWRRDLAERFPSIDWADATDGGEGLLSLYEALRDHGIVRVQRVGVDPARTEALAELIGPVHETTVYGRIYDVRAEPVAKLGAKTGMPQAPHIDDAFSYSQPGIDVFHCLVNTDEGGMSVYVDGFAIAEAIREEAPDSFDALTTLPIGHIRRHPGEIDLRNRGPLISLDEFGRPSGIRYFDRALAPLDVAPGQVDRLYNAIREFDRRMISDEFTASIRVAAGDGMLIDNHRVLHGRTAFDPSRGRHIRLCHVPRDEFHGRLRELGRSLRPADFGMYLPQGSQVV